MLSVSALWPGRYLYSTAQHQRLQAECWDQGQYDSAWLYRYHTGSLTFTPGIGMGWNSKNQNKYYYNVSGKKAQRSGMQYYKQNSSFSPYVERSVDDKLTED